MIVKRGIWGRFRQNGFRTFQRTHRVLGNWVALRRKRRRLGYRRREKREERREKGEERREKREGRISNEEGTCAPDLFGT